MPAPGDVTQMLVALSNGRPEALDELMPLVYDELRQLADRYLRRERPDHTLQATALVHEAYLRLIDQKEARWQDRAHFIGIAAYLMRQILVGYAVHHGAAKRGGSDYKLALEEALDIAQEQAVDILALDDALKGLSELDPQRGRLVELRFFGGLTVEETAEVLGLSPRTVKREWRSAKAWLYRELSMKGKG